MGRLLRIRALLLSDRARYDIERYSGRAVGSFIESYSSLSAVAMFKANPVKQSDNWDDVESYSILAVR